MIKSGQFILKAEYIRCIVCCSRVDRLDSTTDGEWEDITRNFIEGHKTTCDINSEES